MFGQITTAVLVIAAIYLRSCSGAVVVPLCTYAWQTSQKTGLADTAASMPQTCTAASAATTCTGGINAKCQYSYKVLKYICCYDLAPVVITMATPDLISSTYATPATPVTPRNLRPTCPNGAPSTGGGSSATICDPTKANNCPQGYTCSKAANVYDAYGTPSNPNDDLGAAMTPYLCCLTSALSDFTSVFTSAGLTPDFVAKAPTSGLNGIMLGSGMQITNGENWATLPGQLTAIIQNVTLSSPVTVGAYYHIIFFDKTSNKELCIQVNIAGVAGQGVALTPATMMVGANSTAIAGGCVLFDSMVKGNYSYKAGSAYVFSRNPSYGSTAHQWVVLVYMTMMPVTTNLADTSVANQFNFGDATTHNGDLVPVGTSTAVGTPLGLYATASGLLKSAKLTPFGTPVAGAYFYLTT